MKSQKFHMTLALASSLLLTGSCGQLAYAGEKTPVDSLRVIEYNRIFDYENEQDVHERTLRERSYFRRDLDAGTGLGYTGYSHFELNDYAPVHTPGPQYQEGWLYQGESGETEE